MSWDCLSVFCKPCETFPVLAGQHGIGLGCFQSAALELRASTTRVTRSVSSLLPRSPSLSADGSRLGIDPAVEPSGSKRYSPRMHSVVDQYVTSTTGSTPDSERCSLFSLLKPRELPVKKCNLESLRGFAPPLMLRTQVKGGQIHIQKRREEEECGLHLLSHESFCREQNRIAATPVLCHAVTLLEFLAC